MSCSVIAHGANSLVAIDEAAAAGVNGVELDVRRRADGTLVLAHDRDDVGAAVELGAALDRVVRLGLDVQVDVKEPGFERALAAALDHRGLTERAFVSSPSPGVLRACARADPRLVRSLTYPEDRAGLSRSRVGRPLVAPALRLLRRSLPWRLPRLVRAADASRVTLNHALADDAALGVCRDLGVEVCVWTVDDRGEARRLAERGVVAIITDDPRILAGRTFTP